MREDLRCRRLEEEDFLDFFLSESDFFLLLLSLGMSGDPPALDVGADFLDLEDFLESESLDFLSLMLMLGDGGEELSDLLLLGGDLLLLGESGARQSGARQSGARQSSSHRS